MTNSIYKLPKRFFPFVSLLFLFVLITSGWSLDKVERTTVFVNVSVIPMDSERILENQTVLIRGEKIIQIDSTDRSTIPAGAQIIDGKGKFLMPGLADMHAHLLFDDAPEHMALYPAHGVTTIRNLNALLPLHFEWREKVKNGEVFGPTIYTSGPTIGGVPPWVKIQNELMRLITVLLPLLVWMVIWGILRLFKHPKALHQFLFFGKKKPEKKKTWMISGTFLILGVGLAFFKVIPMDVYHTLQFPQADIVETVSEARNAVALQKAAGVDFIKLYDYSSQEVYLAAADEANKQGVYAAGHLPAAFIEDALRSGISDAVHVSEFSEHFFIDYDPESEEFGTHEIDMSQSKMNELADIAVKNNVALVATLITPETMLLGIEDLNQLLMRPENKFVPLKDIEDWKSESSKFIRFKDQGKWRREKWRPLLMKLTKTFHDRGVPILLGTDSDVVGIVPGMYAHRELELLVEAGLTPFEALAAGTRNSARIAEKMVGDGNWGTVEIGKRADLILVEANPLEDVRNTTRRAGVMVRGKWYSQTELEKMLDEMVEK